MLMLSRIVETAFKFMERGIYKLETHQDLDVWFFFSCRRMRVCVCVCVYFIHFHCFTLPLSPSKALLLHHPSKLSLAARLFCAFSYALVIFHSTTSLCIVRAFFFLLHVYVCVVPRLAIERESPYCDVAHKMALHKWNIGWCNERSSRRTWIQWPFRPFARNPILIKYENLPCFHIHTHTQTQTINVLFWVQAKSAAAKQRGGE